MHPHSHDYDRHRHGQVPGAGRAFAIGIALNIAFVLVEWTCGVLANSLSLVADATHNFSDVLGLVLAWGAMMLARRPPSTRFTYGLRGTTILAAMANAVLLLFACGGIAWEAVGRFGHPVESSGAVMIWVAAAGVLVNSATAALFRRERHRDLNVRGAYLHMVTDLAAFVGTGAAAGLILLTGWDRFDPVASLLVAGLMLWASAGLLRESARILLLAAPESVSPEEVGSAIAAHPGVVDAHDLHVWTVTSGFPALSAHVLVEPAADCHRIRLELERLLHERFGLEHTTLQVDHAGADSGLQIRRPPP